MYLTIVRSYVFDWAYLWVNLFRKLRRTSEEQHNYYKSYIFFVKLKQSNIYESSLIQCLLSSQQALFSAYHSKPFSLHDSMVSAHKSLVSLFLCANSKPRSISFFDEQGMIVCASSNSSNLLKIRMNFPLSIARWDNEMKIKEPFGEERYFFVRTVYSCLGTCG